MTFDLAGGGGFLIRTVPVLASKTIVIPAGYAAKNTLFLEAWGAGGAGFGRASIEAQCAPGSSGEYRAGWYDLAAAASLVITIPAGIAGPTDNAAGADPSDTTITGGLTLTAASGISATQSTAGVIASGGSGGTIHFPGNIGVAGTFEEPGAPSPMIMSDRDLPSSAFNGFESRGSGSTYKGAAVLEQKIGIGLPAFQAYLHTSGVYTVTNPGGAGGKASVTTAYKESCPGLVLLHFRIEV